VNTVVAPDDDYGQPQPGGSWLSGSAIGPMGADTRPEFGVAFFAVECARLLAEHDIAVDTDPGRQHVIEIAAADLLRAFGVRPASAPWRS
jgi:hypothetical protein